MYQNFWWTETITIALVTLNRPEKRNPINEEMLSEFEQIVMSLRRRQLSCSHTDGDWQQLLRRCRFEYGEGRHRFRRTSAAIRSGTQPSGPAYRAHVSIIREPRSGQHRSHQRLRHRRWMGVSALV